MLQKIHITVSGMSSNKMLKFLKKKKKKTSWLGLQSVITLTAKEQLGFIKINLHWNLLSQLSFYHLKYINNQKKLQKYNQLPSICTLKRCTIEKLLWLECN